MFTSYRLPVAKWTVGGVNWQNRVYTDTVTPYASAPSKVATRCGISSPLPVTKTSLQGNVNNLFDKTYDTNVEGSIVYGTA